MSRFCGIVGYVQTEETAPGVWTEVITEKTYRGDVSKNIKRYDSGENLNDNISVNNTIEIIADAYANENFFAIRYIYWMGTRWKVTSVEVRRPRLILSLGGVYNGPEAGTA